MFHHTRTPEEIEAMPVYTRNRTSVSAYHVDEHGFIISMHSSDIYDQEKQEFVKTNYVTCIGKTLQGPKDTTEINPNLTQAEYDLAESLGYSVDGVVVEVGAKYPVCLAVDKTIVELAVDNLIVTYRPESKTFGPVIVPENWRLEFSGSRWSTPDYWLEDNWIQRVSAYDQDDKCVYSALSEYDGYEFSIPSYEISWIESDGTMMTMSTDNQHAHIGYIRTIETLEPF
jgi:hypothetical protein